MSTLHFGKFYYRYKDERTSDGTSIGETGYSDEDEALYRIRVRHLGEDADDGTVKRWYERQLLCSNFSEGCLKMGFLHLSEKRVVVSDYESDLMTWINDRYEKHSTKYWQEENRWWISIREDFLKIFQPVFASLKKMHLMKGYHGNLNPHSSIKIQSCGPGQVNGVLTDMQCQDFPHIENMQRYDAKKLREIICEVIYRPYGGQVVGQINEVHQLCFSQLDYFLDESNVTDLKIRWGLDPVLFWSSSRQIKFLRKVYWILYQNGKVPALIEDLLSFEQWTFEAHIDQAMDDVHSHKRNENPTRYDSPESIVKFYRNCLEHLDFNIWGTPNYPKAIHELFLSHYDILSPSIQFTRLMIIERPNVTSEYVKKLIDSFIEEINI